MYRSRSRHQQQCCGLRKQRRQQSRALGMRVALRTGTAIQSRRTAHCKYSGACVCSWPVLRFDTMTRQQGLSRHYTITP